MYDTSKYKLNEKIEHKYKSNTLKVHDTCVKCYESTT